MDCYPFFQKMNEQIIYYSNMATTPNSAITTSKEIDKFLKEIRGCTDHISAYGDWDEIIPTCEHIIDTCNAMKNACQEAVTITSRCGY